MVERSMTGQTGSANNGESKPTGRQAFDELFSIKRRGRITLDLVRPELLKEWHPEKNTELQPDKVSFCSNKKAWWVCEKGHEWEAKICQRYYGSGCPYCSGKKVSEENSLQKVYPQVAEEWHPEKNGELTPNDVTPSSAKKIWWLCKSGHEWYVDVRRRTQGAKCPFCSGRVASEKNCLYNANPALVEEWHPEKNGDMTPKNVTPHSSKSVWWLCKNGHEWEATVFERSKGGRCPYCSGRQVSQDNNLQITYPSIAEEWHPTLNGDLTPENVTSNSSKLVWWRCKKKHEWQTKICNRTKGRNCPYCSGRYATKNNNLAIVYPEIAEEWHPLKNSSLLPRDVKPSSGKKVWWKCKKGHEWQSMVVQRTKGSRCPFCAGRVVTKENCLSATNPGLAEEWNYEKNTLTPDDVTEKYHNKVWWKCKEGHEWQSNVYNRYKGSGCPFCGGKRATEINNLMKLNPELAGEWHPTKNAPLTPSDVTLYSAKKVWWQCQSNHEWTASVSGRANGNGCPFCAGMYVTPDTSLAVLNPSLAKEWHPTKNKDLTPENVKPKSEKKVWWKCARGHQWKEKVSRRNNRNSICPICRKKVRKSLFSKNPLLSQEWHPDKNEPLTPRDVRPNSNKKVWWVCRKGHEWEAIIANRNKGMGCPHCRRKRRLTISGEISQDS